MLLTVGDERGPEKKNRYFIKDVKNFILLNRLKINLV